LTPIHVKKNQNKELNQPVLQFKQNKLADLLLELHLLLLELDLLLLLELLLHCWSGPSDPLPRVVLLLVGKESGRG